MAATRQPLYQRSVFINCPFDGEYLPIFRAIIFTVSACGFEPRSTLEHDDASQVRIEKIYRLIASSAFGIHDISRTEPDDENRLPRFNMPLELGVFLGAKGGRAAELKSGMVAVGTKRDAPSLAAEEKLHRVSFKLP